MYKISDLIPKYKILNETYTKIIQNQKLDFKDQRYIYDFHEQFKDLQLFESTIIELIKSLETEKLELLLRNLNEEINTNISLYNENKSFFDNINLNEVCKRHYNSKDDIITFQAAIHKEAYENHLKTEKTLREAKDEDKANSLSAYNHFREKWELEKNKHFELLESKKELEKETYKYHTNTFELNNKLTNSFLNLLATFVISDNISIHPLQETDRFFDLGFSYKFWKETNDIYFEKISDTEFYNNINLLNTSSKNTKLRIKRNCRTKVAYIIKQINKHMKHIEKEYWKEEICKQLDIEKTIKKRPSNIKPSIDGGKKDDQEFIDKIQTITDYYNLLQYQHP